MAKYGSRNALEQVVVRNPIPYYEAGVKVREDKELIAEFGVSGGTYYAVTQNPETGSDETLEHVDIRGNYLDTEIQAEQKGWTDAERKIVEACLDENCRKHPGMLWRIEKTRVPKPIPSIDTLHHNQVPVIAEQTGLVREFLAWELDQDKPRESVVAKLEGLIEREQQAAELTAA